MQYLERIIRVSAKGIGFIDREENNRKSPTVEIDANFLNTALHGDRVKVLLHSAVAGQPQTGEVVAILERKRLQFVGTLERENGFFYLVPDDRRLYKDVLIPADKLAGGQEGEKVQVEITEWHDPKKDPLGRVLTVIGRRGDHEAEMRAIVYEKGFQPNFPPGVEAEAEKIKQAAASDLGEEIKRRRDCRAILTFTIDPADAKDFDDAISYQRLPNGNLEIGVHIADVSHYLQPGTKLDQEARRRATSIYLVDRTIPMLPEVLSDDLCSLNPNEDKLTFSAIFTFNQAGEVLDKWFGRTVIHSDKRFTYEEVQQILDQQQGQYHDELAQVNKLAYQLRAERQKAGAISFDRDEIKFVLDQTGHPIRVLRKGRTDANLLVEDLMLLANRQVAEFVSDLVKEADKQFVYRVHDWPDRDKLQQLANFLKPLGYDLDVASEQIKQRDLNRLLLSAKGKPEETMIQTATMRSMAKAVYDLKNIGHYGLAFPHYTHFTSPIRRYPDVMVHRLLAIYLTGSKPPAALLADYAKLVVHASQMELNAQEAERDSVKYKQVEYLADRLGQTFSGVISGLAKWGIFVQENETLAEGLVRLFDLNDDYYVFNEAEYSMIGQKTGKRFRLGDKVRIKLLKADVREKTLDFIFV